MQDLKNLANNLPKIEGWSHHENLKIVFQKGEWHSVDIYVTEALKEAHRRTQLVKVAQTTTKINKFITRLKNLLKCNQSKNQL